MKNNTADYLHSAAYAYEYGKLDQYRASREANIACRNAIDQAIYENYQNNRLDPKGVQQVLKQFDYDRIFYVLANTVRQKNWDGRISRDNKAWAQTISVCEDRDSYGYDRNCYFVVDRSHTGLMDLFMTEARRERVLFQKQKTAAGCAEIPAIMFICFGYSAFQRNAQPLLTVMISGVWGRKTSGGRLSCADRSEAET